jgi:thiol-disulfide isomerase/thioredoxin
MPRLTRRFVAAAALATGGTVVGALIGRKYDAAPPETGPSPLQTLDGLRPITPPTPFPAFTWQVIGDDGKASPATIASQVGRGVVLNIWATWCDPCTREMPSLARLADAVHADRIVVLPVSIDRDGASAIRPFYRAHAITNLPVLTDQHATSMAALAVSGVPTTFLVGADGRLRARFEGAADWGAPAAVEAVARLIGGERSKGSTP